MRNNADTREGPQNGALAGERVKVFFVDHGDASFILRDLSLIEAFATVRRRSFRSSAVSLPWALLLMFAASVRNVLWADVVVAHFAGWGSLLPLFFARLLGRRGLLVVHGADCVSLPAIGYGNFRKWPLSMATRWCFRCASAIVPVHASLVRSTSSYPTGTPVEQGVLRFVPDVKARIHVVPHGFEPNDWPNCNAPRDVDVLTVGLGFGSPRKRALKGVDLLLQTAERTPALRYVVVGWDADSRQSLPTNVTVYGRLSRDELVRLYGRSKVYAQLSMSEGFGCALAEAMLCGALPLVSDTGSLPDVAGGCGAVLGKRDPDQLVSLIGGLLADVGPAASARARGSIALRFPIAARARALVHLSSC